MTRRFAVVLAIVLAMPLSSGMPMVTPAEHVRGTEQTYLTFPEWFLVHSPAEYANYVRGHTPTEFPFWGHIRQFWSSYAAVTRASNDGYPFNVGYHVMILVIGASTTVEYALRSAYETFLGRLSEATSMGHLTDEDRYGAEVAQDYVDFIRKLPWYEFDFIGKLTGLWRDTPLWGPGILRKWERKYALSTEYLVKAGYGWIIKKATKASYEEALLVTAVVLDRLPLEVALALPELKVQRMLADGAVLALVPRYHAFMTYAATLAQRGVNFREIAGNRGPILLSVIAPAGWKLAGARELFRQPILTEAPLERVAVVVDVDALSRSLLLVREAGARLEHVYDY